MPVKKASASHREPSWSGFRIRSDGTEGSRKKKADDAIRLRAWDASRPLANSPSWAKGDPAKSRAIACEHNPQEIRRNKNSCCDFEKGNTRVGDSSKRRHGK